jgi:predicted alpha/beta-fold hydrolase
MDVAAAADALHRGASRLYEHLFVRELMELFRRKASLFPEIFHLKDLRNFRSMREFDNDITAPYSGYRDADDIYASISSSRRAEQISVPTLIIQSKDDPFIRLLEPTRAKLRANPAITFVETDHGGHCGFVAKGRRWWAEEVVEGFFREQAKGGQLAVTSENRNHAHW